MTLLPPDIQHGIVVGRWLITGPDTADEGREPNAAPAVGSVRFTPIVPTRTSYDPKPTTVLPQPFDVTLDAQGEIHQGGVGVPLAVGQWVASFTLTDIELSPTVFEVTVEHTEAAPLHLPTAPPLVPVAAEHVVPAWAASVFAAVAAAEAARDEAVAAAEAAAGGGGGTGTPGASAYEVDVANGYVGTVEEWLADLRGADGASAYDLAVAGGFVGTVEEWLASQKGEPGEDAVLPDNLLRGVVSDTPPTDTTLVWLDTSGA